MLGSEGSAEGPTQISVLDAPLYIWMRMQRHGNASDVNKRVTKYEPDKTGLGLDDVRADSLLRALKYLVADGLGQLALRGPLGNATEV